MRIPAPISLLLLLASCGPGNPKSLCDRFFTPWPDIISQRERTPDNSDLMDAMAHYSDKQYAQAIPGLERVIARDDRNFAARLYLANALLATGDPYKAEMHLDFLENYKAKSFSDQVEWYNALCWLCEGDTAKAGQQARWIASRPHTYRKEAQELGAALAKH